MRVVVSRREALLGRDERVQGPEQRVQNLTVGFELCWGHVEVNVSDFKTLTFSFDGYDVGLDVSFGRS
ncbi:hypothetical protein TorRG33x02_038170 [Trema orientale]|uniref:Uncharacterized protein n=1 Tax=Trema orientale TaxID=63057 RepID=A0A2P5FRM3_TREOI|nr:hypothetical protein TorRG33x02_038170 [Trema orientale]